MPRVNSVKRCRKSPGSCGKCGKKIAKGKPYIWWKFRYGGKRVRCDECPRPRASELINSPKLSAIQAARESIEDAVASFRSDHDFDALHSALEDAAESVREVAEEYRESAQNIEDGFGHSTSQSDELNERGDAVEAGADHIDDVASRLEEFDEDAEENETDDDREARREEWAEAVADEADEAAEFETD